MTYGSWTFEILEAHGDREEEERSPYYPLEDFDIRFTNAKIVTVLGKVYKEVYVGTGSFRLGENLSLVCGGSGVTCTSQCSATDPSRSLEYVSVHGFIHRTKRYSLRWLDEIPSRTHA